MEQKKKTAVPWGQDGGIKITEETESGSAADVKEDLSMVGESSFSSDPAGCRVEWPAELNEVQACLVEGINEDLTARYLRAKYKNAAWKKAVERAAKLIIDERIRYEKVEKETGVFWWVVGALHMRESNNNFSTWLANGDSLTRATVRVPAGLKGPGNPPWEWHVCAVISLNHQNGNRKVKLRNMGEVLDYCEHYNGLGYRQGAGRATVPPSTSPYLWSGTTEYVSGKYVADGKFDVNAVDQQIGVAAVFMCLEEMKVTLFSDDIPNPPPLPVSWWELFRGEQANIIVGYAGPTAVIKKETLLVDELTAFLKEHPDANTFRVAPTGKEVPEVGPKPAPEPDPVKTEPFIKLTRKSNSPDARGLVPLKADFFGPDGKVYGTLDCISGLPGAQHFRKGPESKAGSGEPLPQGKWSVGKIEFVGARDDYSGSFGVGLGPMWVGVEPEFSTARSAIGWHRDDNSIGTMGCIGVADTAGLKKLAALLRQHDPKVMVVDWGI